MKNILRRLAVLFCLMLALALPAFAEGEKGEANITPQTTMKELRENPSIKGAGIYTYVYVWERDCGLLKSSKDNDTMLEVIGKESINSCVAGMNFLIDTYNTGTQITYKLYTPEECKICGRAFGQRPVLQRRDAGRCFHCMGTASKRICGICTSVSDRK